MEPGPARPRGTEPTPSRTWPSCARRRDRQILGFYLPTHYNGSGQRDAESQDLFHHDSRNRLDTVTHQACAVTAGTDTCTGTVTTTGLSSYTYDDNDNRTAVAESSTNGTTATRTYCYDALNRLVAEKATTTCATTPDETYTYDDAGNRLTATVSGSTRSFSYGTDSQLDSCTTPTCTISYDAAGRSATITDTSVSWTFAYDAEGRVSSACKSTACSGSIDRVDYVYDGSGHRTQIKETTSAGAVTTTDFRYQGDAIIQEVVGGTVTRTYATDDTGKIVEVCDPDCATGTIYVVTDNGHGDALALWRKNADGTLTLANSYTYSTWGTPTTTVAGGFSDLKFRFLYVGASDVQWDASFGLALLYMHARHYSPAFGRFIQPDPSRADGNLYGYARNSSVTESDPSGLWVGWRKLGRKLVHTWAQRIAGALAITFACPGAVLWVAFCAAYTTTLYNSWADWEARDYYYSSWNTARVVYRIGVELDGNVLLSEHGDGFFYNGGYNCAAALAGLKGMYAVRFYCGYPTNHFSF